MSYEKSRGRLVGRERQDSGMILKDFDLDNCDHRRQSRFGIEDKLTTKHSEFKGPAETLLEGLAGNADNLSPAGSFAAAVSKLTSGHVRRAPG